VSASVCLLSNDRFALCQIQTPHALGNKTNKAVYLKPSLKTGTFEIDFQGIATYNAVSTVRCCIAEVIMGFWHYIVTTFNKLLTGCGEDKK